MCKRECTFGLQYCCLECPENDTCRLQCDYMVKDIKAYHQSNTEAGLEVSNEAMAHFLVYVEHEHIGNTHFVKSCAVDEVRLLLIAAGINKELNDVE